MKTVTIGAQQRSVGFAHPLRGRALPQRLRAPQLPSAALAPAAAAVRAAVAAGAEEKETDLLLPLTAELVRAERTQPPGQRPPPVQP